MKAVKNRHCLSRIGSKRREVLPRSLFRKARKKRYILAAYASGNVGKRSLAFHKSGLRNKYSVLLIALYRLIVRNNAEQPDAGSVDYRQNAGKISELCLRSFVQALRYAQPHEATRDYAL